MILCRKMLCRVYSLFHRISKKHYYLKFSFLNEYLAYFNTAMLFLPHTSNLVKKLHGISNQIVFMLFHSNLTTISYTCTLCFPNKVRGVNPYWYVDLGGIYMIRHIDIFNRPKTSGGYFYQILTLVGQYYGFSVDTPYQALSAEHKNNRIIK
jgi:hypothetical protein